MAYADIDDVKRELGKYSTGLTATSTPTATQVTEETIPNVAGIIDGVLSARGLTVPVTEPASFLEELSNLNALGAAARVAAALYPQAAGPASTTFHEWLQKLFDAGLDRLRSGEGVPHDADIASAALPRSYWTTTPTDPDTEEAWEPMFKRRGNLW